jgi:ribulose-5-phosphate 4-epimerase/fuculose-1-phosphate aldolase
MRIVKIVAILLAVYVAVVVAFETWLGYSQPSGGGTIEITTVDDNGKSATRVVSRIESGGHLYVAANHWPRAWYRDALDHPDVTVTMDGVTQTYTAVPVTGEEFDRVNADHPLGPMIRFLTGFPPRRVVRLDPTAAVPG